MGELFTPTHLAIVDVVAIVFFGGKKLPGLGKGLSEGLRGFKNGMRGFTDVVHLKSEPSTPAIPEADA